MTPLGLKDFAQIVGGSASGPGGKISGFATDNREVKPGDLFLAIKGAKVDGHDFAADAIARGAVAVLAERPVDGPHILVSNLVDALAKLGSHFRDQFHGPVVGITGSAGKTTTKEFLAAALSPLGSVLKTVGNRNTEYTAPLLWAELTPRTKVVVVEMAMRGAGQIAQLASFSRPNLALITNIGFSHLEMVGSREGIAKAKAELLEALPAEGVAILPRDDDYFEFLRGYAGKRVQLTFGAHAESDCRVIDVAVDAGFGSVVRGFFADIPWQARIPVLGRHLAVNAAAAVATAAALGLSPQEAADALGEAELPPLRMQVLDRRGVKILLDAYNAAPPSMIAAIETLAEMPAAGRRLAVIGEMKELGEHTEEAHRQIGRAIGKAGLDEVLFVGEPMKFAMEEAAGVKCAWAGDSGPAKAFVESAKEGDVLLIKGSRALALEKAVEGVEA